MARHNNSQKNLTLPGMGLLLGVLLCALVLPGPAIAQEPPKEPLVDESFSIRQDQDLYQMEEAIALIATSLNQISDRVKILAINSLYFGGNLSSDFRRKAEVIMLERLFEANPTVQLAQCQECQTLETKISRGVLRLRKGIPTAEARKALAKKLGVDGFIDLGIFRDGSQITVYLKVTEAQTGSIILVDELAGRVAYKRQSVTYSFGEMTFPLEVGGQKAAHDALVLGINETVQLTGRFSFGVDLNIYTDNNTNNPDALTTLDAGILFGPYLGFDVLQLQASTSRLLLYVGLGKMISPQLNYANLLKAGVQFIVGDKLVIAIGINNFLETYIEGGQDKISGTGNELRFGYRF